MCISHQTGIHGYYKHGLYSGFCVISSILTLLVLFLQGIKKEVKKGSVVKLKQYELFIQM
jgi:hypothetical protein